MDSAFHILKPSFAPPTGVARFSYRLAGHEFVETLTFPPGGDATAPGLEKMLELTAVVLGASYFKLRAPLTVVVDFALSDLEREFAHDVYTNGLGEFYARNGLYHFDRLAVVAPVEVADERPAPVLEDRLLLPIGGGKDSLVSVHLLEAADVAFTPFAVNPKGPILTSVATIGLVPLYVTRALDPEMLRLSATPGYLNGHVPSTAINSMVAALAALLFSYNQIALSNERSASTGNMMHDGREVNHQYSKSLGFERRIKAVLAAATGGALDYFSLLRPYSEFKIGALFARDGRFDRVFSSCNRNFKLSGSGGALWCGACPKCHFTFLMLATHLSSERMATIFGANFLDRADNAASFAELTGLAGQKPWECVGEIEEAAAALSILAGQPAYRDTQVVTRLTEALLGQYGAARLEAARRDLLEDAREHEIPPSLFERIAPYAL